MAGMVGSSETGVYSAAISQSPVTDWHYYGMCAIMTVLKKIQNYVIFLQIPSTQNGILWSLPVKTRKATGQVLFIASLSIVI